MRASDLEHHRFATVGDKITFKIVHADDVTRQFLVAKRGQRASYIPYGTIFQSLALGVIEDITDGWRCKCGGLMFRDPECRVETIALKVINGYHVRGTAERKVTYKPVWQCSECEHCEEER